MMARSTRGVSRPTRSRSCERRLSERIDAFGFRISGEILEADAVDFNALRGFHGLFGFCGWSVIHDEGVIGMCRIILSPDLVKTRCKGVAREETPA
jgi:hypothetical protein